MLQIGSRGEDVRQLQQSLGITPDGIFGPKTQAAVKAFQQSSGLVPDGIVGPKTINALISTKTQTQTRVPTQTYTPTPSRNLPIGTTSVTPPQTSLTSPQTEVSTKEVTLPNGQVVRIDSQGNVNSEDIKKVEQAAHQLAYDTVSGAVASGSTVNPNANLDDIDFNKFLQEAENTIAPEYKQKFGVAKEDLLRTLGEIEQTYGRDISKIGRETEASRLSGRETLAERGLTFGSGRQDFETQTTEAQQRTQEESRRLAFENAGKVGRETERATGTNYLSGLQSPQIEGRSLYETSKTPLVGSLESEKQYLKESIARENETRERQRRALALGNLYVS